MAIADDATSPRLTNVNGGLTKTVTSASFTPPSNSLLVAMVGSNWNAHYALLPPAPLYTFTDSLTGTWTKVSESDAGSAGAAASAVGYRTISTGAAMTVAATWNADALSKTQYLVIAVLNGAASTGTIAGSLFSGGSLTGATTWATKTVTTTTVGSLVLSVMTYDVSGRTLTANGVTTQYGQNIDTGVGCSEMAGRATSLTTTPGSLTIGWSISGTGTKSASGEIVEIMPAAAGGPIRVVNVLQAVKRASFF
jgi:hypothetical protein